MDWAKSSICECIIFVFIRSQFLLYSRLSYNGEMEKLPWKGKQLHKNTKRVCYASELNGKICGALQFLTNKWNAMQRSCMPYMLTHPHPHQSIVYIYNTWHLCTTFVFTAPRESLLCDKLNFHNDNPTSKQEIFCIFFVAHYEDQSRRWTGRDRTKTHGRCIMCQRKSRNFFSSSTF